MISAEFCFLILFEMMSMFLVLVLLVLPEGFYQTDCYLD